MKLKIEYVALTLILFVTVLLWFISKPDKSLIMSRPLASAGQLTGLIGFVFTALTLLLSAKPLILDRFFGGLDRQLRVHQILGSVAFVLLVNHPLFFIVSDITNFAIVRLYLLPGSDLAYTSGILGLYVFLVSFVCMVFIKLPYHIWKLTHKILGVGFAFGGVHALLIPSDVSRFIPLAAWVSGFLLLGLISYIYSIFLYIRFGPRRLYKVENIERTLDVINIYLKPIEKSLSFSPGQFVYASFQDKSVTNELHPFTISSSPNEQTLRLSIKITGDYTLRLPGLNIGTAAWLYGPYGSFGSKALSNTSPTQIWVAGGIGITPFVSFIRALKAMPPKPSVHLFYIYRHPEEAVFKDEIEKHISDLPFIRLQCWITSKQGRVSKTLFSPLVCDPKNTSVFICGPNSMTQSLTKQFRELQIPARSIIAEKFTFE